MKALYTLEFNKIVNKLSEMSQTEYNKPFNIEIFKSLNEVTAAISETEEGVGMILRRGNPPISQIKDLTGVLNRCRAGAILSFRELLDIAALLRTCHNVKKYQSKDRKQESYPIIDGITENISNLKELEQKISSAIIDEETIADDASPSLLSIRQQIKTTGNKIKDSLLAYIRKMQKFIQEPIITMRNNRYVIPVKAECKNEVPGILHDTSSSGATLFIEPSFVVVINNEIRNLIIKEQAEIERILAEITNEVFLNLDIIVNNINLIVRLDFIFTKAKYGLQMNAAAPIINDSGITKIIKGRHPLLDPLTAVPVDIEIGESFDALIITGPNTGGKTVSLKTLGLLTVMTQAGLLIPAMTGTQISIFENIFADIGDEQSIEQSLSTFSSHMKNIVNILENFNDRSLILFDELGAGTDPVEGAALAMAILDYTLKNKAKVAATTHYSELKLYALSEPRVQNAACEFDVETLRPTYKLLIGVPGKSNAFAISKKLGLNDFIIDNAKGLITSDNIKLEDILNELEESKKIAKTEHEQAIRFKEETENLKIQLEQEKDKFEKEKTDILNKAREKSKNILNDSKEQADEIIKRLKQLEKEKNFDNKELEEIRTKFKENLRKVEPTEAPKLNLQPIKEVKIGDSVRVLNLDKTGTVLSLPNTNGDLFVQVGIMKISSNLTNLKKAVPDEKTPAPKKPESQTTFTDIKPRPMSELDLRGETLDNAILTLDKFIDECTMSSLKQICIIHGKGTGALRAGVHEFLRSNKAIKSFRLGKYGEGEAGVTICEIK